MTKCKRRKELKKASMEKQQSFQGKPQQRLRCEQVIYPWRKTMRSVSSMVVPYSQILAGWPSLRTGTRGLTRDAAVAAGDVFALPGNDGVSCGDDSGATLSCCCSAVLAWACVVVSGGTKAAPSLASSAGTSATTSSIITKWWYSFKHSHL